LEAALMVQLRQHDSSISMNVGRNLNESVAAVHGAGREFAGW
jgi:hypothetical protein